MRDTVNNLFKPQVLGAINVGKQIQLDLIRLRQENADFEQTISDCVDQNSMQVSAIT